MSSCVSAKRPSTSQTQQPHLLCRRPLVPARVSRRARARLLLAPDQVVAHALAQVDPAVALQAPSRQREGGAAAPAAPTARERVFWL